MTTEGFIRRGRMPRPRMPGGEITIEPPPQIPRNVPASVMSRLLPVVMLVAMVGMMALFFTAGSESLKNPATLLFPMMMLMSVIGMFSVGRVGGGKRAAELNEERKDYLRYVGRLREDANDTAKAQFAALSWSHPEPNALLGAVGSRRMWERRSDDPDFCHVRIGVGSQRLATRISTPETGPIEDLEPIAMMALRRFVRTHSVVRGLPTAVSLRAFPAITIDGPLPEVGGLIRSIILQLCTFHGPESLRMAVVCADPDHGDWSWVKWLPHLQHDGRTDGAGSARMVYQSLEEFERDNESDVAGRHRFSRTAPLPVTSWHWVVIIADGYVSGGERVISDGGLDGITVIDLADTTSALAARRGLRLIIEDSMLAVRSHSGPSEFARADTVGVAYAEAVARRMSRYRLLTAAQLVDLEPESRPVDPGLMRLIGVDDAAHIDPDVAWRPRDAHERLRVPVGLTPDGRVLEIDIKEAAENGMGPHGLCIGATGSGKSEFLRTLVLSMAATHSPDTLNLVLVDFKGGATFLGLDGLPHVAAIITNLEDELAMVDRMRDALSGELNRRQELLRAAGNFAGVSDYEKARANGAPLDPLPALFVVVDEFSELLSQKPDFAELFAAIGRLGRSLHVHLLLASQRLDEGKLRGVDSHLSYRIGLKTFSASESRSVLGIPDAYHLPAVPGSAYLKYASMEAIRFNTSYVSGPYLPSSGTGPVAGTVGDSGDVFATLFTAAAVGARPRRERRPAESDGPDADSTIMEGGKIVTTLDMVVRRLVGHGRPAHEVWLPPLGDPPAVSTLLPVSDWRQGARLSGSLKLPIGVVDRPYDQRRDIMYVDLSGGQGHAAIVGGPQSGKSTALRTVIMSAALTHSPEQVQFYCLDFGGGSLTGIAGLPHVGSVATRLDEDRVRRTVAEVILLLRRREERFRELGIESMARYRRLKGDLVAGRVVDPRVSDDEFGDVFLVVDGWSTVLSEFDSLTESLYAIATQGLSFGIHLIISASRWMEIRSAVKDQIGTRIELRLGDPSDSDMDRRLSDTVPVGRPGRGMTPEKLHMLIAAPLLGAGASAGDLATGVVAAVTQIAAHYGDRRARPIRMLPDLIPLTQLADAVYSHRRRRAHEVIIGVDEAELASVSVDFAVQPHLLIFGDGSSGKTALLRTIIAGLVANGGSDEHKIILIDYRRTLLGEINGNHLAGYATSAQMVSDMLGQLVGICDSRMPGADITSTQLRDRSWWSGPEFYVIVDDYDMVAVAGGNPLLPLADLLSQARDIGAHLILARRSGGASRALFDPIIARLKDLSTDGVVLSAGKDEGVLLGSQKSSPKPPGRGLLVSRSRGEGLIQVAWVPPAG